MSSKRRSNVSILIWGLVLTGILIAPGSLVAEAPSDLPPGQAWYVVRPGDTMQSISQRYFGTTLRWPENWKLNPQIENPDSIAPGTRIRILVPQKLPAGAALLLETSRRVDDLLRPLDWSAARPRDVLRERDGVRTYAASSAELQVGEDTRLRLTEDSLVFVGREVTEEKTTRDLIEIDLGQADLQSMGSTVAHGDIEIVVGGARARPSSGKDAGLHGRVRRPKDGGIQWMVYDGESVLEAGGDSVDVPAGMGTSASEGAPPAPPEKLLDPPAIRSPEAFANLWTARPEVSWQSVEGAVEYSLELCGDPACSVLLARATGVSASPWTSSEDLMPGQVFARVTATAPSGLDGFPSPPVGFTLKDPSSDSTAPTAAIGFRGPSARMSGRWFIAPETAVFVAGDDPESGIATSSAMLDGAPATEAGLAGPWASGSRHVLEADVKNHAGGLGRLEPVSFAVDDRPPTVLAGGEAVDASIYARGHEDASSDEQSVTGLVWRKANTRFAPLGHEVLVSTDDPPTLRSERIVVRRADAVRDQGRSKKKRRARRKASRVAEEDAGLWLEVLDSGAGLSRWELRAVAARTVEILAVDAIGNETRVEVQLP